MEMGREKYNWNDIAGKTLGVYRQVLARILEWENDKKKQNI